MQKNIYDRICRQCRVSFKGGPRAWYCPACRINRRRASDKKRKANGRKANRPIGSTDICPVCKKIYIVNSGNQKYCPSCAPEQIKLIDRKQGLEYYNNNRDKVNLRRIMTRYQDRHCVVCGKPFKTKTKRLTCSGTCQKIYINIKWIKNYNKRKSLSPQEKEKNYEENN